MRADADFMVYVAARWPSLVREAVLLGCPPEQAAQAATDALSRCRRDWGRASREENVDRLVHDALVAAVATRPRTDEASRAREADELLVLAPPTIEDLARQQRSHDVAVLRRAAMVAVPILLVAAGVGGYLATDGGSAPSGDEDEIGQVAVERAENPAPGVVWYADGRLHLDHVVLEVDGVRDMTRLGNGVVYGDDEGRVVYAADDGSREVLGHKDPDVPVAATDETGLAAWFDPDTEEIVGIEVSTGHEFLRTGVADRPRVVAVDGDVVYLVGGDGARALLPTGPASELPVSPADLLDVRSRVRVYQLSDDTIQMIQSAFNVAFEVPGRGARLSVDGNTVATRLPDAGNMVAIYDTRSGAELPLRLGSDDTVLVVAPGPDGTVALVVAGDDGEQAELRTCVLAMATCEVVAEIPESDDIPVLAR
jgi:hypothetical protein